MTTPPAFSAEQLLAFLELAGEKGWLAKATQSVMKSNSKRVLECLDEDERRDVRSIDVDSAVRRFANLNPKVAPRSLRDYKARLEKSLGLFVAWAEDRTAFRMPSGRARPADGSRPSQDQTKKRPKGGAVRDHFPSVSHTTSPLGSQQPLPMPSGISFPFPLRPDVTVVVTGLPRNLKLVEAERLAACLRSMAEDFKA